MGTEIVFVLIYPVAAICLVAATYFWSKIAPLLGGSMLAYFAPRRGLRRIDIGLGGSYIHNERRDVHRTNSARLLHRSRALTLSPATYRRIGNLKFGVRAPSHFLRRRSSNRKAWQETSTDT
mgnify:CR=1 FL=1